MEINDWDEDEAYEWYNYNIVDGFVGELTPIFVDCSVERDSDGVITINGVTCNPKK